MSLQNFAKGCFITGTMIATSDGDVPIENLSALDQVISYNEVTGREEDAVIGAVDVYERNEYYVINSIIGVTSEHPFYTTKGIIEVKDLSIGDKLIIRNQEEVIIDSIELIKERIRVYNLLEVKPNHNYYAAGFLVHNKGCFPAGQKVSVPGGTKPIEQLKPGDEVISFNDQTKEQEISVIESVRVVQDEHDRYKINDFIIATGSHPFYTDYGLRLVENLMIGDKLFTQDGKEITIYSIQKYEEIEAVYNLLDVLPNNNYYVEGILVHNKGGGGCFLAGTMIDTPKGRQTIEQLQKGDKVWSINESGEKEESIIGQVEILASPSYYTLNNHIQVTAEHPFYVYITPGVNHIITVENLVKGMYLVTDGGVEELRDIKYNIEAVVVYNLINVEPNNNYFANGYLVHNKGSISGGAKGGTSSGAKSSSGSTSKSSTSSAPKAGTSTAKPGSKVNIGGKEIQTSTKTPSRTGFSSSKGVIGDNGYRPRFRNGYNPPDGSVVYYNQTSFADYLPWIYLFGHSDAKPENRETITVEPDGKEVQAKPVQEGTDGLAILNWIILILIIGAIIGGAVWGVNKLTSKKKPRATKPGYGW